MTNQTLRDRWLQVLGRIEHGRAAGSLPRQVVRLIAVSKTRPAADIRALAEIGQRGFGENYVDEALAKQRELDELDLEWHFIGPIQSNKTRAIAEHFDWVQSVDRLKIVRRLGEQRPAGIEPLQVLIQVDLDDEPQKAGCRPEQIAELARAIAAQPRLRLRGLMAIPAPRSEPAAQRAVFERLTQQFELLKRQQPGIDTLSAGMSDDLEAAIAAGSNMVRVGTDLFGPR